MGGAHGTGPAVEGRDFRRGARAAPGSRQGGATQPAGQGRGLHLGLLPELLAVKPLHLHSGISLLIGGALQSSRGLV